MSIDERARLSLYQRLEAVLGTPDADTMMSYLPPQGWGEVATKGDLALLRGDVDSLRGDFDSFRREMRAELRAETALWRAELADLRTEVTSEIAEVRSEVAAVRTELRTEIAEVRIELHRGLRGAVLSLVTVMVALAAGQMALLAAMV